MGTIVFEGAAEDAVIVSDKDFLDKVISTELVKHNVTDSILNSIKEKYLPLKINGVDDKENYELVHNARIECKNLRILAKNICKKGREHAIREQEAWIAKEKEIVGRISEVEDHLDREESAIDEEKERAKKEKIKAENARFINRTVELTKMGVAFDEVNFKLGEVEYSAEVIKGCSEEIYRSEVFPKFHFVFEINESARLEKEKKDKEEKEQFEKAQEEFRRQQKEFQDAKDKLLQDEKEAKEKKEREDREEADRVREGQKKLFQTRIGQLQDVTFNGEDVFYNGVALQSYSSLINMDQSDFIFFRDNHNITVADNKAEAERKRLEEIEQAKKEAAEKALEDERKRKEEEEEKKKEALAASGDKAKWKDYVERIGAIEIPEFNSRQYRELGARVKSLVETLKNLKLKQ